MSNPEKTDRRCVFCGKCEKEFEDGNMFTEEHVVPFSLGNKVLKINDVCKNCNSGMGAYIDDYFVNNMFVKILRYTKWTCRMLCKDASRSKLLIKQFSSKAGFLQASWTADYQKFLIGNGVFCNN